MAVAEVVDPAGENPEVETCRPPTSATSAGIGYLPTLDGWRAIAILIVLLAHAAPSISIFTSGSSDRYFALVPNFGLFGVRIFFGLSGFLICSRLIEENAVRGRISLRGFYIRRFFRIIPPLVVMMLVFPVIARFGQIRIPVRQWLAGLFFAANYVRAGGTYYLGHLWSLAVEEHFYLLFPGILVLIGIRRGLRFVTVAAVGVAVWRVLLFKFEVSSSQFNSAYFWGRTDIVQDGLLWGCAVAFLYSSPSIRDRMQAWFQPKTWSFLFLLSHQVETA